MSNYQDKWWKRPKNQAHDALIETLNCLKEDIDDKNEQIRHHLSLYLGQQLSGVEPSSTRTFQSLYLGSTKTISARRNEFVVNITQSVIDTLVAKIATRRPKPQFLTSGGDWNAKEKARKLEKYVEGVFYQNDAYETAIRVFLDAAITGTGFLKVFYCDDEEKVKVERVFPGEVIVDEQASMHSKPRSMNQIKLVSADVLAALFPKKESQIREAAEEDGKVLKDGDMYEMDLVQVVESWHLRSSKKVKDGRHVICINNATLFDEDWDCDEFPFISFRWTEKPIGFYGQGLAEQLNQLQAEINKLASRIQQAMHIYATTTTFSPKGSINKAHLKNVSGYVVEYDPTIGPAPHTVSPPAMNSQVFDHMWSLYQKAYEISGVSVMSASSTKPSGVRSGVALRTLLDTESQRFATVGRQWESFFCKIAKQIVSCSKSAMAGSKVKSKFVADKYIETIDFADVDMDEDSYHLKVYPTNMLPSTPAGRLATVEEMLQAGFISPKEGMSLLEFPDLEKYVSTQQASSDAVDMAISKMLSSDDKEYIPPEPWLDLQDGISRVTAALIRAKTDGADDESVDMLYEWIEQASGILEAAQLEAQQQQMAMQQQQMMMQQQAQQQAQPQQEMTQDGGQPV